MLKFYNTLIRQIEEFVPLEPGKVSMYSCGPTVYDYPQIGNWRTFVLSDVLRRTLEYNHYQVNLVMNATDVGHLSGDNLGDADVGEDRLEKGAKREGKTVWEIAQIYLTDFVQTREWLNILPPSQFVRATEHIEEQIELVKKLVDKALAYQTETGVFFDVSKFPDYGKLGGQKLIDKRTAAREEVAEDKTKKHPQDFALWFKRVGKFADHQMHWDSPWGEGFPGWHIECSAMSMKYLGETFDIHTGGVDHIAIHHTNEIAQSEGATGKQFVKYWVHGEFLTVGGGRMGKSLGNAYTLHDIKEKGFDPLALRYFYFSAHYRQVLNFTWEALTGAQNALERLQKKIVDMRNSLASQGDALEMASGQYEEEFLEALNDDLNMPKALAVVWKLVEDKKMPAKEALESLYRMDLVLGLDLKSTKYEVRSEKVPIEIEELLKQREKLRGEKKFAEADKMREEIEKMGYTVLDTAQGQKVEKSKSVKQ